MAAGGKGRFKKQGSGYSDAPVPPVNDTPGCSVEVVEEGDMVYAKATGFDPGAMNVDFQSHPAEGNESTKGIGISLYTTDDDGSVNFPVSSAYVLPDRPRTITAKVWDDLEPVKNVATDTKTFT